jgi:hypothetical protein
MSEDNSQPPESRRSRWLRILTGAYFVQRALLLVLAALLSGLVVPLIFKTIDQSRERQQFIYRAQSQLFNDASEILLTYQTLALDVSWYGTPDARNPELQRRAFTRYSERMAEIQTKLALQAARARTLTSAPVGKKLDDFLGEIYKEQDTPINQLWTTCETKCDWQPQHTRSEVMAKRATSLITELANDLGLVKRDTSGGA